MGYADAVAASGAVAYWPMTEDSGTTLTDVIAGQNMTLSGGYTLAQPGPFAASGTGRSVQWNGSTGKASAADSAAMSMTGAMSIETWVKTTATSGIFVYKAVTPFGNLADRCYEFDMLSGTVYFVIGNRASTTSSITFAATLLNDGAWHHAVCTWDGTTAAGGLNAYIDSALVATGQSTISSITDTADPVVMGTPNGPNNFPLAGSQAHTALYGRGLTAGEVYHHYKAALREGVSY